MKSGDHQLHYAFGGGNETAWYYTANASSIRCFGNGTAMTILISFDDGESVSMNQSFFKKELYGKQWCLATKEASL